AMTLSGTDAANYTLVQPTLSANILKRDQVISFTSIGTQELTNTVVLSATASSTLDVNFSVASGPATITDGTTLSFSGAGPVEIFATQSGDENWNAAPVVTNSFDVIGVITNVAPDSGTVIGGTEVVIDGLWLGNGTDVTNVTICNVAAEIVSQEVNRVTVLTGASDPVEITGDVVVQSAGFGAIVLSNAFTYLPFALAPEALSATDISTDRFTAHWKSADESTTHYFVDVSESPDFTNFTGSYSNWNAGDTTSAQIAGLSDGVTYYYRVRAANPHGTSLNSNVITVPVSDNTPYLEYETNDGVASSGSSDVVNLTKLVHGSGMQYEVVFNSNPSLVTAEIVGTELLLNYADGMSGTALITVRITDPSNGFWIENSIAVNVAPKPEWAAGPIVLNPQTGLFEQIVTVANNSPTFAAEAITLTVTDLSAGAELYNATGTDKQGNPEIFWRGTLEPLESIDFTLHYYSAQRTTPSATVVASLSLSEPADSVTGTSVSLDGGNFEMTNDNSSFVMQFNTVPGKTYFIQYTDSLADEWKTVQPGITASSSNTRWLDYGAPATDASPAKVKGRYYRVIEATQ
ncbi:fibronectin type III domain-containing protein, partial [Verrucomicrobiota bacterium]